MSKSPADFDYDKVESTFVITSGNDKPAAGIDLTRCTLLAFKFPSDIDGAAAMTFEGSLDGGSTYGVIYDRFGTQVSLTVAANRACSVPFDDLVGYGLIKPVLDSTVTADRTIQWSGMKLSGSDD